MGKITATPYEFRKSFGLDLDTLVANQVEAAERTERAYCEKADENFYLCSTDTFEKKFSDTYRDDLFVEFFGSLLSTAIKTQYDLQKSEGKNPSANNIAKDLLEGSLFGKVLPFAEDDINLIFSKEFVSKVMEQTKTKTFREQTRKHSFTKILFKQGHKQGHFTYVDSDLWNRMMPIMKEATFLSRDNLIRLVIYRETRFILETYEDIPKLNEVIKEKFLPSKQTIFQTGLENLLNEIDAYLVSVEANESNRLYWSAEFLWREVERVNGVVAKKLKLNRDAGEDFIKVTKYREEKYRSSSRNK